MHRKLKPIRDLDPLTPAERDQLWTDLDNGLAFTTAVRLLGAEHFLSIKRHKLVTWWHREKQRREINTQIPPGFHITAEDLLALMNGDTVAYNPVGIALLQKRAFDLACAPEISATILASLLRIFHYPKALEFTQRRLQISEQSARLKQLKLDRENHPHSSPFPFSANSSDSADNSNFFPGPLQLPLEVLENNRRHAEKLKSGRTILVRDDQNLVTSYEFPSPEAAAAHQAKASTFPPAFIPTLASVLADLPALTNTSPLADCPSPIPSACSASSAVKSSSSLPSACSAPSASILNPVNPVNPVQIASSSPDDLAKTVDAYTVKRAQEYWAYRSKIASGYPTDTHPDYITQYRHCPCGNATPCPIHESEDYGPYPNWFWTRSPHSLNYADCLRARDLPYRDPKEFL